MPQFDVYRMRDGGLALDCQSDLLDHLSSRLTVPLLEPERLPARIARLHPSFDVAGRPLVMATHLAGAVAANALRDPVASLAEHRFTIQAALDTLTGS